MAKAKQPTPPATLGASLNGLFNKMSNKKPITQDEVKNAFALLLQEEKDVTSDAQIIETMKVLIAPLPPEQHFDVWKSSDKNFYRLYRDENSYDGEADCASPLGLFVMEQMLDSLEDLPRNRRAEAATSCVLTNFGTPVTPEIQKAAIAKMISYLPYDPDAYIHAVAALGISNNKNVEKALLTAALNAVDQPSDESDTPFENASNCLAWTIQHGFDDLARQSLEKAVTFLKDLPEAEREQGKTDLSTFLQKRATGLQPVFDQLLEEAERKAQPNPVANFLAQAKTLG